MKNILLFSLLFAVTFGYSQTTNQKKDTVEFIQLTGIVITDSLVRLPFTKVKDMSTRRGTISDYYGYFAIVVHPGDTIEFSYLGFKKKTFIVPDSSGNKEISLVQLMTEDTIKIDPIDVYPWPSREAFADAFVNMEIPDDEMRLAQQRLSSEEMAFVGALLTGDGGSSYSNYRVQQAQAMYTRGQSPVNNILNPAAWSDFIKGIGTGRYQISQ